MVHVRRIGIAALLLACLLAPAQAMGAVGHAHAAGLRKLTLWLDWFPNSDHAGIYVALARGYYRQAGLDVRVQVPSGAADGLQLVAHGTGDMAVSYEPEVLLASRSGVPVVATGAIVQAPLNCIMTLKSSGITRPRQLAGKTVGISGLDSDYKNITAAVRYDGGDPGKVKTVSVNYGLLPALLHKRVDAVEGVYWTWEALQAQQSGHPVNVMRLNHYGVPTYDELVFATGKRQLASEKDVLRAFQRATFQGYAYAVAHPGAAADVLLAQKNVLSKSRSLMVQSIKLLSPVFHDAQGRYGVMSAAQWQAYADWLKHSGLTKGKAIDANHAMTTVLLQ